MSKCLYCYQELEEGQKDFHPRCSRKIFGTNEVPLLEYRHEDLDQLAEQVIRAQTSLTGVQPKLSLNLSKHEGCSRLTIVGLWGDYIFKPQTENYPQLPENEDLTMHLAEAAKISVVPHSLIRMADGRLGFHQHIHQLERQHTSCRRHHASQVERGFPEQRCASAGGSVLVSLRRAG